MQMLELEIFRAHTTLCPNCIILLRLGLLWNALPTFFLTSYFHTRSGVTSVGCLSQALTPVHWVG